MRYPRGELDPRQLVLPAGALAAQAAAEAAAVAFAAAGRAYVAAQNCLLIVHILLHEACAEESNPNLEHQRHK